MLAQLREVVSRSGIVLAAFVGWHALEIQASSRVVRPALQFLQILPKFAAFGHNLREAASDSREFRI